MKWIKHDTDANQDAKLQNVLLDYGLEGYGLYWYCIELIAGKVGKDNITFELEHDARIIARNTGCTPQKVEEMMRYFVEIGLFENSSGVITCLKLARRLDKSMTSNPEMRQIIESFKSHDLIMTQSEKPMQDKIRLEENKDTIDSAREILESVKANYHKELPMLAGILKITPARRSSIMARHKEDFNENIENWVGYFAYIRENCKWMLYDTEQRSKKGFDFLIKQSTVLKVREGQYNDR